MPKLPKSSRFDISKLIPIPNGPQLNANIIELLINILFYSKQITFNKGLLLFFGWDSEEKKNNNNCVQKLFFSITTIYKYDLLFRGNIIDEMVQELREKPIAINQDEANQQHYEVHL